MKISPVNSNYSPAFKSIEVRHRDYWSETVLDALISTKYIQNLSNRGHVVLDFNEDREYSYNDDPDACDFFHKACISIDSSSGGGRDLRAECIVRYLGPNHIWTDLYKQIKELDKPLKPEPKPVNKPRTETYQERKHREVDEKIRQMNSRPAQTTSYIPQNPHKKVCSYGLKPMKFDMPKHINIENEKPKKKSFWKRLFGG